MERQEREKQREHDKEQQEKEAGEKEKEREFQYTMKKMELAQLELKMKAESPMKNEVKKDNEDDEYEGTGTIRHVKRELAKGPKMPCFDERVDDMDAFLHRFEVYADSQGWRKGQWAVYLSALLKGKALHVYSRLPVKDVQEYETLKDALLKRFNLTEEGFKQKFKSARPQPGEAPTQFIARIESNLMRWIDLANVMKDFNGLMNLIVREQYLESLKDALLK